jgi:hypothetical protein
VPRYYYLRLIAKSIPGEGSSQPERRKRQDRIARRLRLSLLDVPSRLVSGSPRSERRSVASRRFCGPGGGCDTAETVESLREPNESHDAILRGQP